MNDQELTTLEQVRCFLEGTEPVAFEIRGKDECYAWIEHTLLRFRFFRLRRPDKGLVTRYLMGGQDGGALSAWGWGHMGNERCSQERPLGVRA